MSTRDEALRDEALAALSSTDWSGSKVDTQPVDKPAGAEPNTASIVFSVRLRGDLADWVAAEADRRAVNPSVVIRDAVAAGCAAAVADEPITVTRGDLHRLIDDYPPHSRPRMADCSVWRAGRQLASVAQSTISCQVGTSRVRPCLAEWTAAAT